MGPRSTLRWLLVLMLAVHDVAVARASDGDGGSNPSEAGDAQSSHLAALAVLQRDLLANGQRALRAGNHADAIKYFATLTLAAPQQASGFSGLCASYRAAGQHVEAVDACRLAAQKSDAGERERAALFEVLIASGDARRRSAAEDARTEPLWGERLGWLFPPLFLVLALLGLLVRPAGNQRRNQRRTTHVSRAA